MILLAVVVESLHLHDETPFVVYFMISGMLFAGALVFGLLGRSTQLGRFCLIAAIAIPLGVVSAKLPSRFAEALLVKTT